MLGQNLSSLPNQYLTEEHLRFFHKYGFVVVRGLHTEDMTEEAKQGASYLISMEEKAIDWGEGEISFQGLPEGNRSSWGRCQEPRLMKYFDFNKNVQMCKGLIGDFKFGHYYEGPGYYTFAPRFYYWSLNPYDLQNYNQTYTTPPYNPNNLQQIGYAWSEKFIKNGAKLNLKFAGTDEKHWHIDGWDYKAVGVFSLLWGSYMNALPYGYMGNFIVYPGSHHVIASIFRNKGPHFYFDANNQQPPEKMPDLYREGVCDGQPYSVCVEAGDILLAHPWLAHGIDSNMSTQTRLAVYCRLANEYFWEEGRSRMAGKVLNSSHEHLEEPDRWEGDYWANIPVLNNWIKANSNSIQQYDGGELFSALKKL